MPEPASPTDIHSRYVELISDSLQKVGEAIAECAEAEWKLQKIRVDRSATAEQISDAAIKFRQNQAFMQDTIDDHARLIQQFLDFRNP